MTLVPKCPGQILMAFSSLPLPSHEESPTTRGDEASCKSLDKEHGVPCMKEGTSSKSHIKISL